jgi:Holliday junction resolvasome RuvABC endonuclease subunit
MPRNIVEPLLVLGIAPSSRGVGFAVMEGENTLIDWGVKTVKGDKNVQSISKMANLIDHYRPDVIALEDVQSKEFRRRSRVQALIGEIMEMARDERIKVKTFSRKQMHSTHGTKHASAQYYANRFKEELGFRLPEKRRITTSEPYQMDIFDAVALAENVFHGVKQKFK